MQVLTLPSIKSLEEFSLRRLDGAQRHSHCRDRKSVYQKQWYQRNKEWHRECVRAAPTELEQNCALLLARKFSPCADCGMSYAHVS